MTNRSSVTVLGEHRIRRESFRACGIQWIRYEKSNGTNGYATAEEWALWEAGS